MANQLLSRKIGNTPVSAIGYGIMGISAFYGKIDSDEDRLKVLDAAHAEGCTFWDTADVYGDSEELIGKWFKRTGKRDEIFLATKFGATGLPDRPINGEPEYVKASFAKSLKRLGVETVDLYYAHRPDPSVPIEHTVGAMAELVRAGKVKYLGLSEPSANTIRRANAVHPISAVQVEYSAFTLDIEDEKISVLKTCRELGITVVSYSPLGRGLLTGQIRSSNDFDQDDFRRLLPRYNEENFPSLLELADGLKAIGERYGATAGQVALAWLLAQGEDILPIPGTKKIKYLKENVAAAQIKLSPEDVKEIRLIAARADAVQGSRVPPGQEQLLFVDTPEP